MTDIVDDLIRVFKAAGLPPEKEKEALQAFVAAAWPGLPPWSTLDVPVIEEVQKAGIGAGVLPTFEEGGVQCVVLAEAGQNYDQDPDNPAYMIPGGFINLTQTPGSSCVEPSSNHPESPRIGAARETEEEYRNQDGAPLLQVDPARLVPMDLETVLKPSGAVDIVMGMMLELSPDEIEHVKAHVLRLEKDPEYKAAVAAQTINPSSELPEVGNMKIFPLEDVANGKVNLLHPDQLSLFQIANRHFQRIHKLPYPRQGPTLAYREKVQNLDDLQALVERWREQDGVKIGITTGVFDILHPGHISFLEDARRKCDHLIVVIASDRTVKIQKGNNRPIIHEAKRAQTAAGLECVNAVIISDEFYHEEILHALHPDVMFKGHDYADKEIKGADMVGEMVIIPCAEGFYFSSSQLEETIRKGLDDTAPAWAEPEA